MLADHHRSDLQMANRLAPALGEQIETLAHLKDEHARGALADHTAAFHRQTRLITFLNLTVSVSNSILLVSVGVLAVWLWARGAVSMGEARRSSRR
jgi:hypothetical protein